MTPTLILGGYLGAGKTTLVNHLLRHADGRRIAVMVNDFGELTIDADLIEGADEGVLTLAGGCVCCSIGSDLIGALQDVLGRSRPPELILIETSGVALPAAVARSARLLPDLCIEGIVVVLDAQTVRERSADPYVGDLVRQQLLEADLLILNKIEQCNAAEQADLHRWLGAMTAPGTPIVPASQAHVPPELVLGFRAQSLEPADVPQAQSLSRWQAKPIGRAGDPASLRFVSELVTLPAALDPQPLLLALGDPAAGIVRAKGWITDLSGQRHLLQQVGRRIELTPLTTQTPAPGPDRLLVIGLAALYRRDNLPVNPSLKT